MRLPSKVNVIEKDTGFKIHLRERNGGHFFHEE
jgi:hypothetical protein